MEGIAQEAQKEQQDLQKALIEHQQLEIQFQESKIVKQEFNKLSDEAKIYKLIGPVLVPQDKVDADSNVTKRLEFIEQQKKQIEERIQKIQEGLQAKQVLFREQQIKQAVEQKQQS